ncbi:MAG: cytochrome c3 family protein [Actinomycetes bacterium]
MKRIVKFVVVGSAVALAMSPAAAMADNGPHVQGGNYIAGSMTTDSCAGCHRMHTAQSTDGYLLKQSQSSLCYSCHGGVAAGAATAVQTGLLYSSKNADKTNPLNIVGALRGGGFESSSIDGANATKWSAIPGSTYFTATIRGTIPVGTNNSASSAHSIDDSAQTAWGGGAPGASRGTSVALECGSCHNPHGNGNFRILQTMNYTGRDNGMGGTNSTLAPTLAATISVSIADSTGTKNYGTTNYWDVDNTDTGPAMVGVNTAFITNIAMWCSTCHTRYFAPSGSRSTNSGDPSYTYRHTSNKGTTSTTSGTRNCIQCHVSHGSNVNMGSVSSSTQVSTTGTAPGNQGAGLNPDGSIPRFGTLPVSLAGTQKTSMLLRVDSRGTCRMCHQSGQAPADPGVMGWTTYAP